MSTGSDDELAGLGIDLEFDDQDWSTLPGAEQAASTTPTRPGSRIRLSHRLSKNDIRRYFPNMFLCAVNSGCSRQLQNFAHAFVATECRFTFSHDSVQILRIPSTISIEGPFLFSHFMICWLTVCPDLVMMMGNTEIRLAADGRSTTIEMEVELFMFKVSHLSVVLWLPPLNSLGQLYRIRTMVELQAALSLLNNVGISSTSKSTASNPNVSSTDTGAATGLMIGSVAPSSSHTSLSTSTSQGSSNTDADSLMRMPVHFESLLHSAATLLPVPLPLQLRGRFTVVLNAQNKIDSMTLHAEQF